MANENWNEGATPYFQDDSPDPFAAVDEKKKASGRSRKFLGMTAMQRLILSVLLSIVVCMMGVMMLFITGSLKLPI